MKLFALVMLMLSNLGAQIEMRDNYQLGQPIEATITVPDMDLSQLSADQYDVKWSTDAGSSAVGLLDKLYVAHVWAVPGDRTLQGTVAYLVDGKPRIYVDSRDYTVAPLDPNLPVQTKTLRELVGDDKTADALAVVYRAMAEVAGQFRNRAEFQSIQDQRLIANNLAEHKAKQAINSRLARVLDKEPFNASALSNELTSVANELAGSPGPAPGTPPSPGPVPDIPTISRPTQVVYVYDKNQGSIPNPVLAAIDRINRELKIKATSFELGSNDSTDQVPDQYKLAVEEATKTGTPVLVVIADGRVLRTVVKPSTIEQTMEAVR